MQDKRFLKCLDCDYLNSVDVEKCNICGSKNLALYTKNNKKMSYYSLLVLATFLFFCVIVYFRFSFDSEKNKIEKSITFVSEKIPSNYYTYLSSLKKISKFDKPDQNDVNVMINALRYDDKNIREIACKTLKRWKKLPPKYFDVCLEK